MQSLAAKSGTVALMGNSVVHAALLANYARSNSKTTVPVLMTAGAQQLDVAVNVVADTTTLTRAGLHIRTVWVDGVPSEITIPAQRLRVVRLTGGVLPSAGQTVAPAAGVSSLPADYNAPAGAPCTAEDVVITTPRGYTLVGTLTRPKGTNKVPVVVAISGSGPQGRDSRIPVVRGYAPFRKIADTLGRRGIAVLRYDDRGIGESGGASSRATATSADFADDVESVIAYLRARKDIDGARHRAPRRPRLYGSPRSRIPERKRHQIRRTVPHALDSLAAANPWMGFFMKTEPATVLKGSGNTRVTVRHFPATNHLLLADATGAPGGYVSLTETKLRREVLGALADWMVQAMKERSVKLRTA